MRPVLSERNTALSSGPTGRRWADGAAGTSQGAETRSGRPRPVSNPCGCALLVCHHRLLPGVDAHVADLVDGRLLVAWRFVPRLNWNLCWLFGSVIHGINHNTAHVLDTRVNIAPPRRPATRAGSCGETPGAPAGCLWPDGLRRPGVEGHAADLLDGWRFVVRRFVPRLNWNLCWLFGSVVHVIDVNTTPWWLQQ